MPLYRFNPTANGADTTATASAGALWECVDDGYGTEDDDTTYIRYSGGANRCGFQISVPHYVVNVVSVSVESRMRSEDTNDSPYLTNYVALSGAYTDGAGRAPTTSYTNYTDSSLARPGGGSWAIADIRSSTFNIGALSSGVADFKRVTRINALLDLRYATGTCAFLIASLLGGVVGAGVLLREMPGIRAALARKGHLLSDDEVRQAWREMREYRYPRFFDLGRLNASCAVGC